MTINRDSWCVTVIDFRVHLQGIRLIILCHKSTIFKISLGHGLSVMQYLFLHISLTRYILRGTHQFDLFCTSTIFISSTFSVLRPTDFTTTKILLRLFSPNFTSTCTSRPRRSPDLTKGRSKRVEVKRSKYRKGRTNAYPFLASGQIRHENYGNNEHINWPIETDCENVKIESTKFDVETYYDFVLIDDGTYEDWYTGGDPIEQDVPSAFSVTFMSDDTITKSGFVLNWYCVFFNLP